MIRKNLGVIIGFVLVVSLGIYLLTATQSGHLFEVPELSWRDLGEFDYVSGQAPPDLKSLDQKQIKMPGFMVPLEDNSRSVVEFLLVPTPQACIHVPPPPPNQMILIRMKNQTPVAFGPIWVYGVFNIKSVRHQYGESSFMIEGKAVEVYK